MVESVALCQSTQLTLDPTTAAVNAKVEKVGREIVLLSTLIFNQCSVIAE